ncbi:MAG: SH3 domain-containing protein [Pelagibacteraceae bacterium]
MTKKYKFFLLIFIFFSSICSAEIRSLKNNKVNVRLGPSKTYPIKWVYTKKYLPVEIIDEHYNWKKIKDYENDVGWIHVSQLSKRKSVITLKDNTIIFSNPTIFSKPKAKLEIYQSLQIKTCNDKWCNVSNSKINGWIQKNNLWGIEEKKIK